MAQPLAMNDSMGFPRSIFSNVMRAPEQAVPDDEAVERSPAVRERFRRQMVSYNSNEAPGTIVIDTPNTYLYYVLGGGRAIRYGIGVGREGFTWAGVQSIARKQEWPDWHPPVEMIARQPYLPRMMAGGPGNPLGARAMYLGNSLYRIHGTNAPDTIGQRVSSGCIRLTNEDVTDLFNRVTVGTKVVVLPDSGRRSVPVASTEPRAVPMTVRAQASANDIPRTPATQPNPAHSSLFTGASASRLY
jgi:lipoprotein-anchoring transpeptidase ErfK/SrfK